MGALIERPVLLDQHRNYQSFHEAQQEAEDDLDRVIRGKFPKQITSLKELIEFLQDDPKPARLAVIIKLQKDMSKKVRWVVDMLKERVVLPRMWDVAESLLGLLEYRQLSHETMWSVWSVPEAKDARHCIEYFVVDSERNGLLLRYVVSFDGWWLERGSQPEASKIPICWHRKREREKER